MSLSLSFGLKLVCVGCGQMNDLASPAFGDSPPPAEGDVSVCAACGEVSIIDAAVEGGLRAPTAAETEAIVAEPRIAILSDLIKQRAALRRH